MKIIPLGDSALVLRLPNQEPAAVQRQLEQAALPSMIECFSAYDSIGVFYRAEATNFEKLRAEIERVLREPPVATEDEREARTIEIPVCYSSEFASDLEVVAQHTGLTREEVINRHSAAEYAVGCIGFMPGFAYLRGLPDELSTPRRATPRKEVPAGAVAIGGAQTGVYPAASPGGWNIIGRTPLCLFHPAQNPPALLRSGDRVRFRVISAEEFESFPS